MDFDRFTRLSHKKNERKKKRFHAKVAVFYVRSLHTLGAYYEHIYVRSRTQSIMGKRTGNRYY